MVKGRLPQLGEKVLVKAAYNPGQAVPWNAVKVQTLSNQVFLSPGHMHWKGEGGKPLGPDCWARTLLLLRGWARQLWDALNFLVTALQPLLKSPAPPLLHVAALGQKQGILGAQPQLIFQPHRIPPLFPQKREYQWHGCWGVALWDTLDESTCNCQVAAL